MALGKRFGVVAARFFYRLYSILTSSDNWITQLFSYWLVFYGTVSTNRLYHAIEVGNIPHRAGVQHSGMVSHSTQYRSFRRRSSFQYNAVKTYSDYQML